MAVEITRSRKFLKSFLVWAADTERNPKMQGYITRQSCVLVAHASGEGHQLRISLCCPDPGGQEAKMTDAEMRWGNRIMALVVTRLQLETVFAWLSTLGGAHSSLGEKFVEHAHHAGVLSKKQLLLALRLGDPILSAQCKLYYAFSLMQKGQLSAASVIVRQQTRFSKTVSTQDKRLQTMCKACKERLQFYLITRPKDV